MNEEINAGSTTLRRGGIARWRGTILLLSVSLIAALIGAGLVMSPRRVHRLNFWLARSRDYGAVVFLGDSIAARWNTLGSAFPGFKVANRGLDGDSTQNVLARMETDVVPLSPRAIVLIIGTNDLNAGVKPESALSNVLAIVRGLRAHFPHLPAIVCKVTPRGGAHDKFPALLSKFNSGLEASFMSDPDTFIFDSWALFSDEAGLPKRQDFPDLLHPGPAAYEKWAVALGPVLAAAVSRAPKFESK